MFVMEGLEMKIIMLKMCNERLRHSQMINEDRSMEIGDKIKSLRKQHKMTQEELAKKMGTTQPMQNHWENGFRTPSLKTLKKVAKIFNVSLDVLAMDEKDLKHLNSKDQNVLSRLKRFENLDESEKETILRMIDSLASSKKSA